MADKTPRTQIQMERDRARMAELVAEGYSVPRAAEIISKARPYDYTVAMARTDLDWVRAQWQAVNADSYQLHVSTQLVRYERLQTELWDAWNKSKGIQTTVAERKSDNSNNSFIQTVQKDSHGDVSYLRVLTNVLDAQNKLLGLYKDNGVIGDGQVTVKFVWGDGNGKDEEIIGVFPTGESSENPEEDARHLLEKDEEEEQQDNPQDYLNPEPWKSNG